VFCNFGTSSSDPVGSWGPDSLTFWQWGVQNVHGSPHVLVPCCYRPTWPVIHSISWFSSAVSGWTMHARWFLYYIKHQCGFYKAVWLLYKLHLNVWKQVIGLCPDPLLESPREGRGKEDWRRERGGLPPSTPPLRFMRGRRHCWALVIEQILSNLVSM